MLTKFRVTVQNVFFITFLTFSAIHEYRRSTSWHKRMFDTHAAVMGLIRQ